MLSDDAIQTLAEAHFHDAYGHLASGVGAKQSLALLKILELDQPSGIYYSVQCDSEDVILLGDGGFFVYRKDGSIRHFGSGEWFTGGPGLQLRTPAMIRFLLETPPAARPTLLETQAPTARGRKWWQFWS